ncbi:MAG: chorismate synthase [candidate division WOR-3 bacterium]
MIRLLTSGESHGKSLTVIIEGLPAGLKIDLDFLNEELSRRQKGYGRGNRMKIEKDEIEILSGIRFGETIGSPITFLIQNRDFENWKDIMRIEGEKNVEKVTSPRPGHADLSGTLKYNREDIRDILERASARETSGRVAAGAIFKTFLREFGVKIYSHTISIGKIKIKENKRSFEEIENTPLRCRDPEREKEMMELIDEARKNGNSLGGVSEIIAKGVCPGIGSYTHFDRRLDTKIAGGMMSIPSVKAVEIGEGIQNTEMFGSEVHDEIFYDKKKGFYRLTNRAGGIEGGMSNGEDIIVRIFMKPIPTLSQPLRSVDLITKKQTFAQKERADTCIVPAAGVIGESVLAYILTDAFLEKFGGDCMEDIKANYNFYIKRIKSV